MHSHRHSLAVMHDRVEVVRSVQVVGSHLPEVRFQSCTQREKTQNIYSQRLIFFSVLPRGYKLFACLCFHDEYNLVYSIRIYSLVYVKV